MPFVWNLEEALVGANVDADRIDPKLLPPSGWARPWEALPLALHRLINWGDREYMSYWAVLLYNTDVALRGVFAHAFGPCMVLYLATVSRLAREAIPAADWSVWVMLGVWWIELALLFVLTLWGRFERYGWQVSEEEVKLTPELRLPLLLLNYQSFGTDRWYGMLAAFLVASWQVLYAGSWGVLLYEGATRALTNDAYEALWITMLVFFLITHVVTALARASSFSKLRSITRKREAEPSPAERRRITIACLYIFWTLALTLPAGLTLVAYVGV